MYRIFLNSVSQKEHKKLSREVRRNLESVLKKGFREDPFSPFFDVKKLQAPLHGCRLRVGDYRILFDLELEEKKIKVYAIRHRKDAYR